MSLAAEEITGSPVGGEAFLPSIVRGGVPDTGPVGPGVAGAPVPGYGAWSPYSTVQRRGRTGGWASEAADRLGDATDWANGHLPNGGGCCDKGYDDGTDDAEPAVVSTALFGRQ